MRYFTNNKNELLTMYSIAKMYLEKRDKFGMDFDTYLESRLADDLQEIPQDDGRAVKVETFYHINGCLRKKGEYYEQVFFLKRKIRNADEVNWEGVNFVLVDLNAGRIFQTSGYTDDRGLFNDLYKY